MNLVKKDSPLPRYYQIYKLLRSNIMDHTYMDGQQLPSERVLSEQYNVNRFTVRRAIETLIGEGLVYPIRRKGYFVKSDGIDIFIHKQTSYTKSMLEKNLKPKVKILEIGTQDPSPELKELFELNSDEKIWSIYFQRYYNNIPFALSKCYLSYERLPELNIHLSRESSLYSILNKKYGILPTRVSSICEACFSDKTESKLLSLLGASPLLKVTSTAIDQKGKYVEMSVTKFRSDMVRLKVDL